MRSFKEAVFLICVLVFLAGREGSAVLTESPKQKQCAPFKSDSGLAKLCGYNSTVKFLYEKHYSIAEATLKHAALKVNQCSPYANELICSVLLPRCEEDIDGPYLPCRRVCDEVFNKCGNILRENNFGWVYGMCQLLAREDNPKSKYYLQRCYEPDGFNTSIQVEDKLESLKCHPLNIPICQGLGFTETVLSKQGQQGLSTYISNALSQYENTKDECKIMRKRLFCTQNLQSCMNNKIAFFCRDKCKEFVERNCSYSFYYDPTLCMEFPEGDSDVDICEQTHWPRAGNWPAIRDAVYTAIPTEVPTKNGNVTTGIPSTTTDTISSPGIFGHQDTGSVNITGAVAGGVIAAVCLIIIALGIAYFLYKRKKHRDRFPSVDHHAPYMDVVERNGAKNKVAVKVDLISDC